MHLAENGADLRRCFQIRLCLGTFDMQAYVTSVKRLRRGIDFDFQAYRLCLALMLACMYVRFSFHECVFSPFPCPRKPSSLRTNKRENTEKEVCESYISHTRRRSYLQQNSYFAVMHASADVFSSIRFH